MLCHAVYDHKARHAVHDHRPCHAVRIFQCMAWGCCVANLPVHYRGLAYACIRFDRFMKSSGQTLVCVMCNFKVQAVLPVSS